MNDEDYQPGREKWDRAARYLRKFHPWYVERLGEGKALQAALQQAETLPEQRAVIDGLAPPLAA